MSIEDVDYMKENSIKENYTFIVDSKFRDQNEYPEPNNYVVNFDIPFKNVFGIEILDVSVPKTMYNIDRESNKLYIYINTCKNSIINYYDMAKGLVWKKFKEIKNTTDNEIINFVLSDDLKNILWKNEIKNTTDNEIINLVLLDDFISNYGITNLNKYNYIRIVNIYYWKKINIDITTVDQTDDYNVIKKTDNYISFYNPQLSEDLKSSKSYNLDDFKYFNVNLDDNINKFRSYNIIPIIDDDDIYLRLYNTGKKLIDNNYGLSWEYIGITKPNGGDEIDNSKLIILFESLKKDIDNIINFELSLEQFESLKIDINDLNNYIKIVNSNSIVKYYKPKTNLDIGKKWIRIDDTLNNYILYKNNELEIRIKNKIMKNHPLTFTNIELNDMNYNFNNNINTFIKIITGLKWGILYNNSNLSSENIINNEGLGTYIVNIIKNNKSNFEIDISTFNTLKLNNITEKSYIIVNSIYWSPKYTIFVPDGTKLINDKEYKKWLTNNSLVNLIKENNNYTNKYNIIEILKSEWPDGKEETEKILSDTIILVDTEYYKIKPSYYYLPKIEYYYPYDILNINNKDDYDKLIDLFFELFTIEIPIGNYTLNKLIIALNTEFRNKINLKILTRSNESVFNNKFLINTDSFDLELQCGGNTIPADTQNILKFEANRHIILNMNNSTLNKTLGFYSKVNNNLEYESNYIYLNINKITNYEKYYHSVEEESKYKIIAPGIVYLIGSEYIILKCPEIEEHLYGSLSYTKNTIGLAKIKVSSWGLNEENASYLKLNLREFHPIGKLSKITLRFESYDGTLYDFRGVNHNIVFAIYYYSAKQKQKFEKSIINPEYKMNFMQYKYSEQEKDEDSDIENENNYTNININDYKKMEEKYSKKEFDNGYELNYNTIRENFYDNIKNDSDDE
mgnify:CR=1 FL=1